jgi:hypothetical protein
MTALSLCVQLVSLELADRYDTALCAMHIAVLSGLRYMGFVDVRSLGIPVDPLSVFAFISGQP